MSPSYAKKGKQTRIFMSKKFIRKNHRLTLKRVCVFMCYVDKWFVFMPT